MGQKAGFEAGQSLSDRLLDGPLGFLACCFSIWSGLLMRQGGVRPVWLQGWRSRSGRVLP